MLRDLQIRTWCRPHFRYFLLPPALFFAISPDGYGSKTLPAPGYGAPTASPGIAAESVRALIESPVAGLGEACLDVPPGSASGLGWRMDYEISQDDGLVLRNVTLGSRLMARKISIPYYTLETNSLSRTRLELESCGQAPGGSRLVEFSNQLIDNSKLVLEARYLMDSLPSPSQLEITQHYEFQALRPEGECEPHKNVELPWPPPIDEVLPCNPYKLTVDYRFRGGGAPQETLHSINIPQRIHFQVDNLAQNENVAGVFRDNDGLVPPWVIEDCENPVNTEAGYEVIRLGGDIGSWDSYHQTFRDEVLPPGGGFGDPPCNRSGTERSPGCPECAHVHWRWTNLAPEFDFGDGKPMIPLTAHDEDGDGRCDFDPSERCDYDSDQDLDIAVTRSQAGEEDPTDFHDLLDGQSVVKEDIVFWYSSTGHLDEDRFWIHNGFFSSSYVDLRPTLMADGVDAVRQRATYNVTLSNDGPGDAHDVELDVWVQPPEGVIVAGEFDPACTAFSSGLVCRFTTFGANRRDTLSVTFEGVSPYPDQGTVLHVNASASANELDFRFEDNEAQITTVIPKPPVALWNNMVITTNIVALPGIYAFDDPEEDGALIVGADNITIDLNGAVLDGGTFRGYGIKNDGYSNVTIINGEIRGYRAAILLENANGNRVEGNHLSGNRNRPVYHDVRDFLPVWDEWPDFLDRDEIGDGVVLLRTHETVVRNNVMNGQQNGVGLFESNFNTIANNNVSDNEGWGIHLHRSSDNTIENNVANNMYDRESRYCHEVQEDGCDTAALLIIQGSHRNQVRDNELMGSGDGLFLAGYFEGSNNNTFTGNDGSFAEHHAFEATFADGNVFENNTADRAGRAGFWLGGSTNTLVRKNTITSNGWAGIQNQGVRDIVIEDNRIAGNRGQGGIYIEPLTDPALPKSAGYVIAANEIVSNAPVGVWIADDLPASRLEDNTFENNEVGIRTGSPLPNLSVEVTSGTFRCTGGCTYDVTAFALSPGCDYYLCSDACSADCEACLTTCSTRFSNLSASLGADAGTFQFSYSGTSTGFHVDLSTLPDMSWDVYLDFGTGSSSPIQVSNPQGLWDKYRCGETLYWRVWNQERTESSPIQTATVCPPDSFSNLSGSLGADSAAFQFTYSGTSSGFHVDVSTLPDMSWDVYLSFGTGSSSPIAVSDPQALWDKYRCGKTLYWRVWNQERTVSSPIQTATVCLSDRFSNLSAILGEEIATFQFSYSGGPSNFHVDVSTLPDMSWDVYLSFGTGSSSPIAVSDPQALWDKYRCGKTLYWRVWNEDRTLTSPIQSAATFDCVPGVFSNLSADFGADIAAFQFTYSGSSSGFHVDLSTLADMSWDVYLSFGAGASSPIQVSNPQALWDKYRCGKILYWRVWNQERTVSSPIQTRNTFACPIFSNLSATLGSSTATFRFSYSGTSSGFHVDLSTLPDMSWDVYMSFGTGASSPIQVSNPQVLWDKYRCGKTLYWRVWNQERTVSSPIQTKNTFACPIFSNLSATMGSSIATFRFSYSGVSSGFHVDLSTVPDMSRDVYLSFGTGASSPIQVSNAQALWDKYRCGKTLYWRVWNQERTVSSPIQRKNTFACIFSNLSATLGSSTATFRFSYSGISNGFHVDLSTRPDMSWDVYLSFGTGASSPIQVSDPQARWDKYRCGKTLYWRVWNQERTVSSPIQTRNTFACPIFSNLSASLGSGTATFRFSYSGTSSGFHVDLSTRPDMSWDVYLSFGTGASSPIQVSNPQARWDKYRCGKTLYWRVWNQERTVSSPIRRRTAFACP